MVRRHLLGRWVWVLTMVGLLFGNSALASGLRCVMPNCDMCQPAPVKKDDCCEPVEKAPQPCGCELTAEPSHDAVIVAKVETPGPEWAIVPALADLPEPDDSVCEAPVPLAASHDPPGDPPDRQHAGRAPPAS